MSLSLEQLQAFVATVETGSFSAAARYLGKAQSAISTAVSNLEIDLDNSLFVRRTLSSPDASWRALTGRGASDTRAL